MSIVAPEYWAAGMSLASLYRSSLVRVYAWRCLVSRAHGSTGEIRERWHLLSFVGSGGFTLHSGRDSAVIDCTSGFYAAPGTPLRMTRHYGPASVGTSLLVRPDVLEEGELPGDLRIAASPAAFIAAGLVARIVRGPLSVIDALAVDETLLHIVHRALGGSGVPPWRRRIDARDVTERAKGFLAEHATEDVGLGELAAALAVSPFHLCREFHRLTGIPLHRYRNRIRLRQALPLVLDGDGDLSAIACDAGFATHSHFTHAFHEEFGITPSELRRIASVGSVRELEALLSPH